ncbi:response regulator transcription factor [Paenibacillus crassostreae]|uniref:AraC family transcriptional regulator n=1 Tax=Paenibacillus crassostreae TaxID=1763538 RepID=A0A167FJ07_9BACL|nr:response regulator [Paenibacillus crassostreae]AOZ94356.1 DNA-binding response regulator [Paenibacillus crassostreae]OAB76607.1 AraC family transcriptional regulator [Paenibacillus crassostreae]
MYKVMLVDDDYPVIELLSETITWGKLGLHLIGIHENGLSAWEQAQQEMPDIIITDIGMPKMNGLELTTRIREIKPNVRIAILSCHSDFQYAQQALRLNVQDYFLKDNLNPEDMIQLLCRFTASIDEETQAGWEQSRMKHLYSETRELRKEQNIKNFIHQPLLSPVEWKRDFSEFGLFAEGDHCLPVITYIEDYRQVNYRYKSVQTLNFAIINVINELLGDLRTKVLHVKYSGKHSFLLFSYKPSLKTNIYDEVLISLKAVQSMILKVLRIQLSFIIGNGCATPEILKLNMNEMLGSDEQRFYLKPGDMTKIQVKVQDSIREKLHLFAYYDKASSELREVFISKNQDRAREVIDQWISLIHNERYSPENVKDWMLKLLLDLKLKLHSLQSIRPSYSADSLYKEIVDMDTLSELRQWLIGHLETIATKQEIGVGTSKRAEVMEACRYVSLRLNARITLDEVAEHLHMNSSYFSRLFKKESGFTFIEYVTRLKMERAKELLDQTNNTVGGICELLGYDNQSYFIKTFKTHAGVTPVEYRG